MASWKYMWKGKRLARTLSPVRAWTPGGPGIHDSFGVMLCDPRSMAILRYRRVFLGMGAAGLTALCQCWLFFDLGGLDNAGAAWDLDAAADGEADARDLDATTDA